MNARLKNAVTAELAARKPAEEISLVVDRLVTPDGVVIVERRLAAILFASPSVGRNRTRPFGREELRKPARIAEFVEMTTESRSNHFGVFAGENVEVRDMNDGVRLGHLVRTYVKSVPAYVPCTDGDPFATPAGTKVAVSWIGEVLDVTA